MAAAVAYLILSHREPGQILRLATTLRRGGARGPILIHHDARACELDADLFRETSGATLLRSTREIHRGDFDCQVERYLEGMALLEREHSGYDWLVYISGQDYPVAPVAKIEADLDAAEADGFLRFWDTRSAASPWPPRKARWRYEYRYRRFPPRYEKSLRALRFLGKLLPVHLYFDYGPQVGVRVLRSPFRGAFRCYGGWSWFTLRRKAVRGLLDFAALRPEVVAHYRRTVVPDESFVQTILANDGRFRLVDDDLRFIDYAGARERGGAARTLTSADFPELASGRFHFARKFDLAADRALLDRVDRELLGLASA